MVVNSLMIQGGENNLMVNYHIRNYVHEDAAQIGTFAKLLELSYRYNGDFQPSNIFCAVDEAGRIGGVGHLEPSESFAWIASNERSADYCYRLNIHIELDDHLGVPDEVENQLLDRIVGRAREIKTEYPNKKLGLYVIFVRMKRNTSISIFRRDL